MATTVDFGGCLGLQGRGLQERVPTGSGEAPAAVLEAQHQRRQRLGAALSRLPAEGGAPGRRPRNLRGGPGGKSWHRWPRGVGVYLWHLAISPVAVGYGP